MIVSIKLNNELVNLDLSKPIDISIPFRAGDKNVNAFYIPPVKIEPFRAGNFVGNVALGGSCNVNNVFFNPHGNGTHTECVGHISKEFISLNQCLKSFVFHANLISILPEKTGDSDWLITRRQLEEKNINAEALIVRTLPNEESKQDRHYSGTNPPYLDFHAALYLREKGVKHLLIDLPSVDKEEDEGKLSAHHAFWNYPDNPRMDCSITELIYVASEVKDGNYLLSLHFPSFENDAAPSKPVLYEYFN